MNNETRFVRLLDPETGQFLAEYEPTRRLIVFYIRGKRIAVDLMQYELTAIKLPQQRQ